MLHTAIKSFHVASQSTGRLAGKSAVIIGGTSGIGAAIARRFVAEGAIVIPVSRSRAKVTTMIAELAGAGNDWRTVLTADVTSERDVATLVKKISRRIGGIDVVVCTAGMHLKKEFLRMSAREWRQVLDVNLNGTYYVNRYFGEHMVAKRSGSIINITSLGARVALSHTAAYCASKAAVAMLTKMLGAEWAQSGVRVNALLPGVFQTELNKKALSDPKRRRNIIMRTPAGRFGNVNELAGAAVYLASDDAKFVTGTEIVVDGGFLASAGF